MLNNSMFQRKYDYKSIAKIVCFIILGTFTFITSLLFLPYEVFLLSIVIVFISLRAVEKELHKFVETTHSTFQKTS